MKKNIFVILGLCLLMTACSSQTVENQIEPEGNLTINNETQMRENSEINQVLMKTSLGDIKIDLDWDNAPISVENFLKYVQDGYYDGTIFHRIINGFMAQGGGFTPDGKQKETRTAIKNEANNGLKNDRGTLAMARTGVVDSATSQFFINLVDNDFLNYRDSSVAGYGYAVFGRVSEGMEVVDAMAKVKTGINGMYENWPIEDVVINSVEFVK